MLKQSNSHTKELRKNNKKKSAIWNKIVLSANNGPQQDIISHAIRKTWDISVCKDLKFFYFKNNIPLFANH